MYIRNCPKCNKEITHKNEISFKRAVKNSLPCVKCTANIREQKKPKIKKEYKRNCPVCNKEIIYNQLKSFNRASKLNTACSVSCRSKETNSRPSAKEKKRKASSGENNPMYKKSYYDIWVERYGKDEADKRQESHSKKCSNAKKGEKNSMFGKPSPQGSGNGWKGWYRNYYFRSLNELYFLIYLIDNNIEFDNAEKKQYRIPYEMNGTKRSYGADFYLIESKEIIEIKPANLVDSYQNKLKFEAAKQLLGNKFKVLTENDIPKLSIKELHKLYLNNEIVLDKRYVERFKDYCKKHLSI
jgi:hypothetical protein